MNLLKFVIDNPIFKDNKLIDPKVYELYEFLDRRNTLL